VAGWINWPHLAQLESGLGWGCKPVVHWVISAPHVKSATSTHTHTLERESASRFHLLPLISLYNKPDLNTTTACVLGDRPRMCHCGLRLHWRPMWGPPGTKDTWPPPSTSSSLMAVLDVGGAQQRTGVAVQQRTGVAVQQPPGATTCCWQPQQPAWSSTRPSHASAR